MCRFFCSLGTLYRKKTFFSTKNGITHLYNYQDADRLVFDLEDLEYMSSAGLRVIHATQKYMSKKGGMKVRNLNDVVSEIFDITGFSDILDIE